MSKQCSSGGRILSSYNILLPFIFGYRIFYLSVDINVVNVFVRCRLFECK